MKNKKLISRFSTLKSNESISPIEGTCLVSIKGGLLQPCTTKCGTNCSSNCGTNCKEELSSY